MQTGNWSPAAPHRPARRTAATVRALYPADPDEDDELDDEDEIENNPLAWPGPRNWEPFDPDDPEPEPEPGDFWLDREADNNE